MQAYEGLASAYDSLMQDVQYPKRAQYVHKLLKGSKRKVHTVVDLGCGTGTISCLLAKKGYGVVGLDSSEEMLTQAASKAMDTENAPLFLHQSMHRLRLGYTVDAIVSTIDAVNYVTAPKQLQETFHRVYRHLNAGGRFIFDVNTEAKFQRMDGQMYVDETEDAYCVWRTFYSAKKRICTYVVDLFALQSDGAWERTWEEHYERGYSVEELMDMLDKAGFATVHLYGDLSTQPPKDGEDRLIFVCEKQL